MGETYWTAVAAVASSVAAIAAFVTIGVQLRELRLTRDEMKLQGEHLAKSADAQRQLAKAQALLARTTVEAFYFQTYATAAPGELAFEFKKDLEKSAAKEDGKRVAAWRLYQRFRELRGEVTVITDEIVGDDGRS